MVALTLACASCAAPQPASRFIREAGAETLRNRPALSSSATLPPLHGPDYGSANNYYDSLGHPATLPPASPGAGGTNPLVGVVPGGNPWP